MSMIGNLLALPQAELDALHAGGIPVSTYLYETRVDDIVSLDKAWNGMHFMLTGQMWGGSGPLANVILGGVPIGEEDVGYGPARSLSAEQANEVAQALDGISAADFRARFDAAALSEAEVYPQIWDEGDDALDYVADYFEEARHFYKSAAEQGHAVIQFIS
jgi:hypothetical protein